ncbi:hypothetical protein CRE_06873 [Caenorhabditis remanei]|uniref:BTB domain-containing protein n=1 Tax=Caenorhabditis remanei TaxID=31234 RepID=E3MZN8_CAERE|nr:hypothetical protein CRE_06873 [Caenorhabditis remanei]
MARDAIEYKSDIYYIDSSNHVMETASHKGIKCTWTGKCVNLTPYRFSYKWKFDWDELKNERVDKLTGHITVCSRNQWFPPMKIDVELTENKQEFAIEFECRNNTDTVYYQYSLTPHYIFEKPSDDEMFAPSDQNDTILVVEGKKLHVSKAFLSYHSEYFRALFSSNFKEGQMDEIPIEDVSFGDFALLLSTFYPNPVFPNEETVETLLEMGRRFLVSSAIRISDYHLMNNSKINNGKMLWMADEYGMPELLEKCIRELDTVDKVKKLHQSPEYEMLSDNTKVKVLDILIKMI